MSELARIIELLEQIIENQQTALDRSCSEQSTPEFNLKHWGLPVIENQQTAIDRSGCEQSIPEFNLKDWGLPEEVLAKLPISLRTLYRYRQKKKEAWIKVGGRSYYHLPTFLNLMNQCMK